MPGGVSGTVVSPSWWNPPGKRAIFTLKPVCKFYGGDMATQVTFDDIVRYLRAERIPFGIGKNNRIMLTLAGENTTLNVQVAFLWEKEIICLWAAYPFHSPSSSLEEVIELAARINWGLLFSSSEVNPDTGAIRFRSTMLVDDAPFNREQFKTLFATACSLADRYAPAFRRVIEGGSVEEALAMVEHSPGDTPRDIPSRT
ncbi:YbjN domain-containing protein [Candidatus Latescibacterota bacterium]